MSETTKTGKHTFVFKGRDGKGRESLYTVHKDFSVERDGTATNERFWFTVKPTEFMENILVSKEIMNALAGFIRDEGKTDRDGLLFRSNTQRTLRRKDESEVNFAEIYVDRKDGPASVLIPSGGPMAF